MAHISNKVVVISVILFPFVVLAVMSLCFSLINTPQKTPVKQEVKQPESFEAEALRTVKKYSQANFKVEDFSFIEYMPSEAGAEMKKSFELSGRKLETKNPRLGIFRINIGKIVELESPEINFYKDNIAALKAKANAGVMNPINKDISFRGNVFLNTKDKRTLTCDKLRWDNEEKRLLAEGDCILKAGGEVISAEKIKTDIELKDFEVVNKEKSFLKTMTGIFSGGR